MTKLEADIQEVKRRVQIVDVASLYCMDKPKVVGTKYRLKSPFKGEKTPSCFLFPQTNSFYCYSSGKGGDVIKLVALLFGISNSEAVRKLIVDFSIPIEIGEKRTVKKFEDMKCKQERLRQKAELIKHDVNNLYSKLCRFYQMFRELLKCLDDKKIDKLDLDYQFTLFNLEFFERHAEIFRNAQVKERVYYVMNIGNYYNIEWEEFKKWLQILNT